LSTFWRDTSDVVGQQVSEPLNGVVVEALVTGTARVGQLGEPRDGATGAEVDGAKEAEPLQLMPGALDRRPRDAEASSQRGGA